MKFFYFGSLFLNILPIFVVIQVIDGQDLGVVKGSSNNVALKFCIGFNPKFDELPSDSSLAKQLLLVNLSDEQLCNESATVPPAVTPSALAVARYNCTFVEKALVAQKHGYEAVIIVSRDGIITPEATNITDYNLVNISVIVIAIADYKSLQAMGDKVMVQFYTVQSPLFDWNMLLIFIVAVGTVAVGAFWSGQERFHRYLAAEDAKKSDPVASTNECTDESGNDKPETVEMTPITVLVLVVVMVGLLLCLYFFYDYMVFIIIALFFFGASLSLFYCLAMLFSFIPGYARLKFPPNRVPFFRRRPVVWNFVLLIACFVFGSVWVVYRNASFGWILQDILGVAFCVHAMKAFRVPNLKICTILLSLLFVYDIFFVFITPLFTKNGESVMVQVATGGGSKEQLPMVLKVPRMTPTDASLCTHRDYSLLGYGDILLPGLLVSFCYGFDLRVNTARVYYIATLLAYMVGLLLTYLALALMQTGQPALLYLVPCTLVTTFVIAFCRGEVKCLWNGTVPRATGDVSCNESTANTDCVEQYQTNDLPAPFTIEAAVENSSCSSSNSQLSDSQPFLHH